MVGLVRLFIRAFFFHIYKKGVSPLGMVELVLQHGWEILEGFSRRSYTAGLTLKNQ